MKSQAERRQRAAAFLEKASKHLEWIGHFLNEMNAYGKSGDFRQFERILHVSLYLVASVHESLADAAKVSGHREWHNELLEVRRRDPLLYYLWKARDAETHDALVKWEEGYEAEVIVVDEVKANALIRSFGDLQPHDITVRLFHHLYGAKTHESFVQQVRRGEPPPSAALEAAGVRLDFANNTFIFSDFSVREDGRSRVVIAPRSHDDKPAVPSAFSAIQRARLFYARKTAELSALASSAQSPPAAPA